MKRKWMISFLLAVGVAVSMLAGCGKKTENVLILSQNEDSPYVAEMDGKIYMKDLYDDIYCWEDDKVTLVRECLDEEFLSYLYAWDDTLYYTKSGRKEKEYFYNLYAFSLQDQIETEILSLDLDRAWICGWVQDGFFYWWDTNYSTYSPDGQLHSYDLSSGKTTDFPLESHPMYGADCLIYQNRIYTNVNVAETDFHLLSIDIHSGETEEYNSSVLFLRGIRDGALIGLDRSEDGYLQNAVNLETGEKRNGDSNTEHTLISVNDVGTFWMDFSGSKYDGYREYYTEVDGKQVLAASFPIKGSNVSWTLLSPYHFQYGDTLFFRGDKLPEGDYIDISPEMEPNEDYLDSMVYQYALKADGTLYLLLKEQQRWLFA